MAGVRGSSGPVLRARGPQTDLLKGMYQKLGQFGKGGVVVGQGASVVIRRSASPGAVPAACAHVASLSLRPLGASAKWG
jgi:hypothetical protein